MNNFKSLTNNYSNTKNLNFGFSILKSLLCFSVITRHCFNNKTTKNIIILFITKRRLIHVPSFILMSFYFNHNTFISSDITKKRIRFQRLVIPYVGWPIIAFIFGNIFKKYKYFSKLSSFKLLIHQIITGQGQGIFHFWYLFDLILTTFIFYFIIMIFKKKYLFVLNLMLFFSYFLQYSELNKKIFLFIQNIKYNEGLSRENELIPFAVTGFTISSFKILNILGKYKFNTFFISLLSYILTEKFDIFSQVFGIAYHGIKLNVLSVCLIIIFSLFPSKISNRKLNFFLKIITNYSGGIFYLHQAIQFCFQNSINDIKNGTFFGVIIIYFISYIICIFGATVFSKSKAKNLFS